MNEASNEMRQDARVNKPKQTTVKKRKRKPAWRAWRILIFIAVWVIVIYAGLSVGYVIVGKRPLGDVFQWATWQHVFDLIFAK
ncbi:MULTISPECIES: DNA-directed RNA polymerase subunit beta [Paenibacillus]|uniref:DNA-directed RNA polymerase subunit beta n=1 Tax=Paenibacillus TaxID=44249 RepID=UPI00036C53AB|nr:DNA-directed RNA polymerase subunit beta [Paenibacillus terrigena]